MREESLNWRSPYSTFISLRATRSMQMSRSLFKQLQPGNVVIAPTPAWRQLVAATYSDAMAVYRREAFQVEQFDADKLRRSFQALPGGFELRQVRLEELPQFATDLDRALIYNFRSHEEFITRAVGMGILHQGRFVSGAAAAAVGRLGKGSIAWSTE